MQSIEGHFVFSASDISSFTHCRHLVSLRQQEALGFVKKPWFDDPTVDALARRGIEHEKAFIAKLAAEGRSIVELETVDELRGIEKLEAHANATLDAMRAGVDVVYQGSLFDGTWLGKTDFLIKVPTPSDLGDYSYEVVDTKLARTAKGAAVLQIMLYAELLGKAQGVTPERVGLALAGPNAHTEYFRVADYEAYYRSVKRRFLDSVAGLTALAAAPDPVEHCGICAWSSRCNDEREAADHLSIVAGITRRHTTVLRAAGIHTLTQLGESDVPSARPADIAQASFERIQSQARLQLESRKTGRNLHELLQPIVPAQGLAALPVPSEGDIYFDLESDINAFDNGIEYLWGYSDRTGAYTELWAVKPSEEKAAFEGFVDCIVARKQQYPDMHVYHYSPHEITALTHMMARYGTRENQVDDLLRGEVFVDLLRVVKQGLRASVDSYSIKKLEPFYDFERSVDLADARKALAEFDMWLEFGDEIDVDVVRTTIRGYNRDDCDSMLYLQTWMEKLRAELIANGIDVPRPPVGARLREEKKKTEDEALVALREQMLANLPASNRTPVQQAQYLVANMLGFHNREDKSYWFHYFDRLDLSADECEEDSKAIGNLEFVGMVPQPPTPTGRKRPDAARYRYPPQEHDFDEDTTAKCKGPDGAPQTVGTVASVDEVNHTIDIKMHKDFDGHPTAIVPHDWINPEPKPSSILQMAKHVAENSIVDVAPYACATQLLLRAKPRLLNGAALRLENESVLDAGRRLVHVLDRTVLPVQGPPGAGKTYLGARLILEAVAAGKKVGVTAPSHAVIINLLDEVFRAADEEGRTLRVVQKPSQKGEKCARAEAAKDKGAVCTALAEEADVVAGTSWLWADEDLMQSVEILFIDEGGQFSLADALAVAPAAQSMVILGDPQQLDQPRKGVHPEGCEVSALDHLLGGAQTIAEDAGLFLDQTWRLHPSICEFTSEIFYNGRLQSRPTLEHQAVVDHEIMSGSGLRLMLVPHVDNQNNSVEEAEAIAGMLRELTTSQWLNKDGVSAPIRIEDVVIVAPYNAQVDRIRKVMNGAVRVGTVDKFQGQEAPVAIYSLASSSAADAPRGMQFLFSPNRFNVATSRGRCLAIVVASPELFQPECKTPEQMRFANAFCRFAEMASTLTIEHVAERGMKVSPVMASE